MSSGLAWMIGGLVLGRLALLTGRRGTPGAGRPAAELTVFVAALLALLGNLAVTDPTAVPFPFHRDRAHWVLQIVLQILGILLLVIHRDRGPRASGSDPTFPLDVMAVTASTHALLMADDLRLFVGLTALTSLLLGRALRVSAGTRCWAAALFLAAGLGILAARGDSVGILGPHGHARGLVHAAALELAESHRGSGGPSRGFPPPVAASLVLVMAALLLLGGAPGASREEGLDPGRLTLGLTLGGGAAAAVILRFLAPALHALREVTPPPSPVTSLEPFVALGLLVVVISVTSRMKVIQAEDDPERLAALAQAGLARALLMMGAGAIALPAGVALAWSGAVLAGILLLQGLAFLGRAAARGRSAPFFEAALAGAPPFASFVLWLLVLRAALRSFAPGIAVILVLDLGLGLAAGLASLDRGPSSGAREAGTHAADRILAVTIGIVLVGIGAAIPALFAWAML